MLKSLQRSPFQLDCEEGSAMKIFDPKKILVPVDFSELSPAVIQTAVEISD